MATIVQRGPNQFRVQVRRSGVSLSKTFETFRAAQDWARVIEGKVTGGEVVQKRTVTTLAQACDWMRDHLGTNPDAKNAGTHLSYWRTSRFAAWSLATIHDWDLIAWRREVLDEDNAEDEGVGPAALFGPQTAIHRLNALSKLIQTGAGRTGSPSRTRSSPASARASRAAATGGFCPTRRSACSRRPTSRPGHGCRPR